jgi:hypothetical protein
LVPYVRLDPLRQYRCCDKQQNKAQQRECCEPYEQPLFSLAQDDSASMNIGVN